MLNDAEECNCPPPGLPAWLATFADLMSLLMCFFVLLLAFSEMDVLKFKQIAGSMKFAFGVQNKIEVKDIPKGTSIIAQEFRPGKPDPTPIETIQQQTVEMTQPMLEFEDGEQDSAGGRQQQRGNQRGGQSPNAFKAAESKAQEKRNNELFNKIAQQLEKQIVDGAIELQSLGQQIIIRIRENGSFPSGSAFLQSQFKPIIREIAVLLNDVPGQITVSGHTDDFQVSNELFINNWYLSSARASAVATEMELAPNFDKSRMGVIGLADTRPLEPNVDSQSRRRNRRVEISILQGKAKESDPIGLN
jgi:chemotaxis protein MotB